MSDFKFGPIQEAWLTSLEQHPERQGKKYLGTKNDKGEYKACCLGELGLIAGICYWVGIFLHVTGTTHYVFLDHVFSEVGLRSRAGSPKDNRSYDTLSNLNDNHKTWPEIAAIVRANPEQYFTKSV